MENEPLCWGDGAAVGTRGLKCETCIVKAKKKPNPKSALLPRSHPTEAHTHPEECCKSFGATRAMCAQQGMDESIRRIVTTDPSRVAAPGNGRFQYLFQEKSGIPRLNYENKESNLMVEQMSSARIKIAASQPAKEEEDGTIRIFLVDDSPSFVRSAVRFLSAHSEFSVSGWAYSGAEALEKLADGVPHLILIDLAMPGIGGFDLIPLIRKLHPRSKIVILTLHDTNEYREKAETIGVEGFVSKAEFGTALVPMVHQIFRNN